MQVRGEFAYGRDAEEGGEDRVLGVLKRYWGYDALRPLQREAIEATLAGRDSLVVLPTGGGKSLCYQIPPVVMGKLGVVVSPLISLMQDQVDGLRVAGYPAGALFGGMGAAEAADVRRRAAQGGLRLLFTAPERLLSDGFLAWLRSLDVGFFAIDEAHCISQWGHDFRPEYRRLAELREHFPEVSFHAYTATATPRVREDIAAQLHLRDPGLLVGTFDRPNLTYRVVPRIRLDEQIVGALERHAGRAAIVYCISRKDTEAIAQMLVSRGIDARAYHAGLDAGTRRRVSEDFSRERLDVVVATVAFGMGIDRADVRCVVHASMPKSIEGYQQETGRAGRDGLPAECLLLYSGGDVVKWKGVMERGWAESGAAEEVLQAQFELLNRMQRLCAGARCRHRALSEYFGQEYGAASCGACDVCLDELDTLSDSLVVAQKIVSCVARLKGSYGAGYVNEVLRGKSTQKVIERGHDALSTFGLLRDESREALASYIDQLIDAGVLVREGVEYPVLRPGEGAREVLKGEREVRLCRQKAHVSAGGTRRADGAGAGGEGEPVETLGAQEQGLFASLRALRRRIADELGVPPYVVFSDATLEELCRVRPSGPERLVGVRGIGQQKLAQFGDRFVEHIAAYCAQNGLDLDARPGSRPAERRSAGSPARRGTGRAASAAMFAKGASVEEVAAELGITARTAADHLAEYVLDAKPASVSRWVDPATYEAVAEICQGTGSSLLRPIYERLGGRIGYDQIRVVVNHLKATGTPTA